MSPSEFREQVRREVLAALKAKAAPLTNRELRHQCPTARHGDDISAALNTLKKRDLVLESAPRDGLRAYVLANPQETAMPATDAAIAAHLLAGEDPDDAECCLDSANGSQAGDEFATSTPHLPELASDPIIRAIRRISEPRFLEGRMHAQRLRALATAAPIAAALDVQAYLTDLADTLEELAA